MTALMLLSGRVLLGAWVLVILAFLGLGWAVHRIEDKQ